MEPKVYALNLTPVFFGARLLAYAIIWLIFGAVTPESAAIYGAGAAAIELGYRGYKALRYKLLLRRAKSKVGFYRLDNNSKVVECTAAETEQQITVMAEMIREASDGKHINVTKAPFYKHAHVGPVCMTAAWTGTSLKGEPIQPWDLVLKLEGTGQERVRSFGSWEEAEAEFDRHETLFRKAASVLNDATKTPTLH